MKYLLVLFLVVILANSCGNRNRSGADGSETVTDSTIVIFEKEMHDFGKVGAGEEIGCRFGFTNAGDQPLVIQDVVAGCGCTNVKYPTKPVQPGEKGAVEVVFDTRGRQGHQRQMVRVISNGSDYPKVLIIRAEVE